MRAYNPNDASDIEDAAELHAEPWMVALLALNPCYVHWGPHEDYMWVKGEGWNSPLIRESWEAFGLHLNELNEVVHFYFEVDRASTRCATCAGNFYHPDAQWISESFYRHSSPFTAPTVSEQNARAVMQGFGSEFHDLHGRGSRPDLDTLRRYGPAFAEFCAAMAAGDGYWHDKLTPDEEQALKDAGRSADRFFHDAINRHILVEQRCLRLGVPHYCPTCAGEGTVFTSEAAHVNVVLWVLHPRKGCSRGAEVRITQDDVPAVLAFLREAAARNAARFAHVTGGDQ